MECILVAILLLVGRHHGNCQCAYAYFEILYICMYKLSAVVPLKTYLTTTQLTGSPKAQESSKLESRSIYVARVIMGNHVYYINRM